MEKKDNSKSANIFNQKINDLSTLNNSLQEENQRIRQQFSEALNFSLDIEGIYSENAKLNQRVSSLQQEKTNLNCRLKDSIQTINSLTNEIEEKQQNLEYKSIEDRQKEKSEISNLKSKIFSLESEKNALVEENKRLLQILSKICDCSISSVTDFNRKFPDYNSLSIKDKSMAQQIEEYKSLALDSESKLSQVISENNDQLNILRKKSEDSFSNLRNKLENSLHENEELKHQLELISSQINMKDNLISQLKSQISQTNTYQRDACSDKNSDISGQFSILLLENQNLKKKRINQRKNMEKISRKYKKSLDEIESLTESNRKLEIQIQVLVEENKKYKINSNSWRQQFQVIKDQLEKAENSLSMHHSIVSQIKDRNRSIMEEIKITKIENERFHQDIQIKTNLIQRLDKKNLQQEKEINELRKIPNMPVEIAVEDGIPHELLDKLTAISRNKSLDFSTKINNIIKTFIDAYQKKLDSFEKDIERKNSQIDSFISYLQEIFPDIQVKVFDLLTNQQIKKDIAENVCQMRQDRQNLLEIKGKLDEQISEILLVLQIDKFSKAKDMIIKLLQKIQKQKNIIQKTNSQLLELTQKERKLVEENSIQNELNRDLANKIAQLNNEKSVLIDAKLELEDENKKILHIHKAELQKQFEEINGQKNEIQRKLQKEIQKQKNVNVSLRTELQNQIQKVTEEADSRISEIQKTSQIYKTQVADQSTFVQRTKKDIDDLNDELNDMVEQNLAYQKLIQQLKQEMIEKSNLYHEKIKSIKDKLRNKYNSMLEQIKQQISHKNIDNS